MTKIHTLSCDIETYSSANLLKSGVNHYCEADDFEILLFGYSIDGGEVCVVDLARGQKIPLEIIDALQNDRIIKWAFNATFERICLSRFLGLPTGTYLDPISWRCTMVWSAYLGLPLSLMGVGVVLGLEKQKLSEGKDLIRYFCTPCNPTIANGGRTRNKAGDAVDKWALFVEYNRRDVEVEMAIHQRLAGFPVPDAVWDEYHLDQRINDRGVLVDRELVQRAIGMDSLSRQELVSRMRELTDLENPNSVSQVKTWLSESGFEIDSLGKKDVKAALVDAPCQIQEVLELRLQLAKSSVKKYQAMENAVCSDGRARGMFQFYGANRTGRWCLTGDHEVLTVQGWERLDEWEGGLIASWSPTNEGVVFSHAKALCFDYEGPMYEYRSNRIAQISTPDHKMYFKRRYGKPWITDTVENMATCRPSIPFTGYRRIKGRPDSAALRVLVMTQADGHYAEDGSICYNFTKQRKIERCRTLLRRAGLVYTLSVYDQADRKYHRFRISNMDVPLWLRQFRSKTYGSWLFDESSDAFFDELPYWDGYRPAPNSIQYCTCNKENADMVQAFAHLSGRAAGIRLKKLSENHKNWQDAHVVDIWLTPGNCHEIRNKPVVTPFNGKVYCAETQTGFFLVRRDGRVWVTGNSGRLIQVQNLRQNHLEDLGTARALVENGDYEAVKMLYGDVPDTLSQLVRTAFIPRKGCRFIVSDFSAIEARVLSWLAGETWRNEVFAQNGDIYCASASQMFRVPVEKHGQNAHLRQKGKISELALGYGGSVGALTAMGALDMGLKEDELKPLVDAWRQSNPNIVKFWWSVDSAAKQAVRGKTTTSTHGIRFSYESGFLFITLPSGRRLAYVKPRIGTNLFGSDCVTYEGVGATKKWERIDTYGPKVVENCLAQGTLVLTERGLVPIQQVTTKDRVWDGVEWVAHEGLIDRGIQETVRIGRGIEMTTNHRILTTKGWRECAKTEGLEWAEVQLPDGYQQGGEYRPGEDAMEISVHPTGCKKQVYDLANCGPRHRFVVWDGGAGKARIVSNCTQAISRDLLCHAMQNLEAIGCRIVMHIHDEVVIEAPPDINLQGIEASMAIVPHWAQGLLLNADGYETDFYKKD
jgi:hypothetical protein